MQNALKLGNMSPTESGCSLITQELQIAKPVGITMVVFILPSTTARTHIVLPPCFYLLDKKMLFYLWGFLGI